MLITSQLDVENFSSRVIDRFWDKVDAGDCWLWTGGRMHQGYGVYQFGVEINERRNVRTHRLSWALLVGPIAQGLHMDHLCRVRHCVNPDHLEPVTCRINLIRGEGPTAVNARKTECVHGHPFDEVNTVMVRGVRDCRICQRRRNAQSKKNRRARQCS